MRHPSAKAWSSSAIPLIDVALTQRDLGPQRLREGLERHPAFTRHQRERVVEHLGRLEQLPAQQQGPAEDRQRPRLLADGAAAPRRRDRLPEQTGRPRRSGRGPTAPCRARRGRPHAPRRPSPARRPAASHLPAEGPRLACTATKPSSRQALHSASRLPLAAASASASWSTAAPSSSPPRTECTRAAPSAASAPRQQRPVADAPCLGARLPQARDAGLDRAGSHGRAPRVQLPQCGRPIAAGRRARRVLAGRGAHPRIGRAPELAPEQQPRRRRRARAPRSISPPLARHRTSNSWALVIEPVERDRAETPARHRRADAPAASEPRAASRNTASHIPASRRRSTSSHASKLGPRARVHPLRAARRARAPDRAHRRPATSTSTRVPAGSPQLQRIPVQRAGDAERAAQLRQRPAQGTQWIVGVTKHQLAQPRPRDRPLGEQRERPARPTPCGHGEA